MKRSVNFGGKRVTQAKKARRPLNLLATMKFVGMTKEEQKRFLLRLKERTS